MSDSYFRQGSAVASSTLPGSGGTVVHIQKIQLVAADGGVAVVAAGELDTNGNPVPTWKAHAFTYDGSGNLSTDNVTNGTNTWVRTYTWSNGAQTTDSGWVKQ